MVFVKRPFLIAIGLLIVMLLSSCGGSTSTGSTATQSSPTSAPTTVSTPQTTPTSTSSAVIQTATASVNGKSETILTDARGFTLYYFTLDTATKTVCTADCTSTWLPLLFPGTGKPTASTTLPGELEVYPNANGKQVIYNDHPLYTYHGDTAPGQMNGEGLGGKWFVATPDLPKNK